MAATPTVEVKVTPVGPQFAISGQCEMPTITATAELKDITPDPKIPLQYRWKVTLIFDGKGCPNATSRIVKHDELTPTTPTPTLKVPFTQVRGGSLTISVSVVVNTQTLTGSTKDLQVVGTNPSVPTLAAVVAVNDAFRKLLRVESGLRQFLASGCPLFSGDGFGGVGLSQLTSPQPTDDQIWSWKENAKGGWALFQEKEKIALAYPVAVRASNEFKTLVTNHNKIRKDKWLAAQAKPATGTAAPAAATSAPVAATPAPAAATPAPAAPAAAGAPAAAAGPPKDLVIELPDYTAEQLQRDTLRAFNGYAGIHEYRVKKDASGALVVTEDPGGVKGKAEWELVTVADRIKFYDDNSIPSGKRGDPNYVEDVLKKPTF